MEALSASDIFQFDRFHLDRRGLFRRDGGAGLAPVEVGARALDVLRVLLKRPGELVSRDEIMAAAWPGIVVEDNNLTIQIAALRHVLDQERANGSCIQTVPRRGYRFVAQVARAEPPGTSEPGSPPGNGIDGPITEREQAQAVGTRGKTVRAAFALSNARYGLWAGAVATAIGAPLWGPGASPGPGSHPRRRTCQLSCCPLPISAAIQSNNILPTASPRM